MNTERMHEYLLLDEKIKSLDKEVTELKSARALLEPIVVSDMVASNMMGIVIGNKQLSISQKTIAQVHNKAALIELLKSTGRLEFIKEDVNSAALTDFILELIGDGQEDTGETLPAEFNGIVSPYLLTKLKITKAKS